MQPEDRAIALIVSCALFMQSIDSTVLGTALAAIALDFHVDPVRLHTVMTVYLLSLAVFMPLSGWLADKYGSRTIFRLAITVFTLASIGCAFAPNLHILVLARILQGAGGAMMVPVARLALLRSLPKSRLLAATAFVSIPALVGPLIGPPLGGFFVTYASWPWIFGINIPIGLAGIVLATIYMPDIREPNVGPIDGRGFFLLAIGVSGLVFGLETLGDGLLPRWANLAAVIVGLAAVAAYVRHARSAPSPIVDLSLLKLPTFHAGVVGGSVFRIGIGAIPFLLPLMLQAGFGYSPLASGLTTIAAAAGALTMKFGVQRAMDRFGFRHVLIWNAVLSGVFVVAIALISPATPVWIIFLILLVGGFFRSLQFTAVNTISYADLNERQMSQGSTFASMAQQLSLSVGVGLSAIIVHVLRGGGFEEAGAFLLAFAIVGAIIAASALIFARLPADAGDAVASRPSKDERSADSPESAV